MKKPSNIFLISFFAIFLSFCNSFAIDFLSEDEFYSDPRRLYLTKASGVIEKFWSRKLQDSIGNENLFANVVIKVLPDGNIDSVEFIKKSGDDKFDQNILKAIWRSNPLPPFQDGLDEDFIELRFHF